MNESDQQIEVYDVNEDELLNRFGMDRRQIDDYQVLCLPENFRQATSKDDLYDTRDSFNLCERLRNAGLKSANSFELNLNIHEEYFVRKSAFDLWLGTLFVLTPVVWEVVKVF